MMKSVKDKKKALPFDSSTRLYWFGISVINVFYSVLSVYALIVGSKLVNCLFILFTVLLSLMWLKLLSAKLFVKADYSIHDREYVHKNRFAEVSLLTRNYTPFTYGVGRVKLFVDEGMLIKDTDSLIFSLPLFKKKKLSFYVFSEYRGRYCINKSHLQLWDDYGRRFTNNRIKGKYTLFVYPDIIRIDQFDSISNNNDNVCDQTMLFSQTVSDDNDLKQYSDSDNLKFIHWKISARVDDWMVKKFYDNKSKNICIFLYMGSNIAKIRSIPRKAKKIKTDSVAIKRRLTIEDKYMEAVATLGYFAYDNNVQYSFNYTYLSGNVVNMDKFICKDSVDFSHVYYETAALEFFNDNDIEINNIIFDSLSDSGLSVYTYYIFTIGIRREIIDQAIAINRSGIRTVTVCVVDDGLLDEESENTLIKYRRSGAEILLLKVGEGTLEAFERFS